MQQPVESGAAARRLMRRQGHAALATSLAGHPYVSLVAVAFDLDASPLLLISDLAQHTENIVSDPRVSLLFDGSGQDHLRAVGDDPLASPRLSLLGEAARIDNPRLLARFTARHPTAAAYARFGDFHLYRIVIGRGHLIAGFGPISWIEGDQLRFTEDATALAAAEAEIIAHMNADHAEAIALYAERLLGRGDGEWRMTGIDPDGIDLRRRGDIARLDFAEPVLDPAAARRALVALAQAARA
jgi:putative heme iron utilization protein